MSPMKSYVYILTNKSNSTLYTGVTRDLRRRVQQHRDGVNDGFSRTYNCTKLVYFEEWDDIREAIEREKKIKKGNRRRKEQLIDSLNPTWRDLRDELMML